MTEPTTLRQRVDTALTRIDSAIAKHIEEYGDDDGTEYDPRGTIAGLNYARQVLRDEHVAD